MHGIKGFVIPSKSFVKIGIGKYFVATTKCLVLSTKRLVAAAKFLVAATKKLFVVHNFVAVTKPFFFRVSKRDRLTVQRGKKCIPGKCEQFVKVLLLDLVTPRYW